jgi:hypothetical protein
MLLCLKTHAQCIHYHCLSMFLCFLDACAVCSLPAHVPVEAVVVWNELVLPLIVELALEVHVLQAGQIRLVACSSDACAVCSLPVHVPVETVVVGDELVLSLIVELALEIHVLQTGQIRLVA